MMMMSEEEEVVMHSVHAFDVAACRGGFRVYGLGLRLRVGV
jgi:hypothetical protein